MVANILTDLTDKLDEWASNWWFLLVIFGIAFLDSVIPIVPSETAVIIGGVVAGQSGDLNIFLVIACGATGAFLGDNTAYEIGARFRPWMERRAARSEKFGRRLVWAREQIASRGGLLLITARFIPGGRTALTLTSGITHQPRAWFAGWVAIAAVIWATYAGGLGYIFGSSVKDNHTLAFVLAFGAALSITIIIEVVRHWRGRRQPETVEILADAVTDEG
jgi:membrane protein DedA with SNARE-associated domain